MHQAVGPRPAFRDRAQEVQGMAVVSIETLQALLYGRSKESDGPSGLNMQTLLD